MKKIVVSASSLPAGRNMSSQIEYVGRVSNFGADMYHVDVMDGTYTKNSSINYTYIEQLKEKSAIMFDVHLMINNPQKVIKKYAGAGADIITVHYDVFEDVNELVKTLIKIRKLGKMAGVALALETDAKVLEPIMRYIDMVLVLCVKAGKSGQKFDQTSVKKIKQIRAMNSQVLIEADGGINAETAPVCVKAGADILVSGNYIYSNDTYEAIQTLKGKNG